VRRCEFVHIWYEIRKDVCTMHMLFDALKMAGRDAGSAPILLDPVNPTIPYGCIPRSSTKYPSASARADNGPNSRDGSELFIVNVRALKLSRDENVGHSQPCPGL
jgi:hypothetical protein